jgi:hypothetical protein
VIERIYLKAKAARDTIVDATIISALSLDQECRGDARLRRTSKKSKQWCSA